MHATPINGPYAIARHRFAEYARLLPLGPFLAALTQLGPEPALLAARFGAIGARTPFACYK